MGKLLKHRGVGVRCSNSKFEGTARSRSIQSSVRIAIHIPNSTSLQLHVVPLLNPVQIKPVSRCTPLLVIDKHIAIVDDSEILAVIQCRRVTGTDKLNFLGGVAHHDCLVKSHHDNRLIVCHRCSSSGGTRCADQRPVASSIKYRIHSIKLLCKTCSVRAALGGGHLQRPGVPRIQHEINTGVEALGDVQISDILAEISNIHASGAR
mmetsp:Transcript_8484/g.18595  ORF Transcript_8484/g.18595 Transcript_8484/m.18595 type:complete len:207 (-) Transcript_8484:1174-1794(-)